MKRRNGVTPVYNGKSFKLPKSDSCSSAAAPIFHSIICHVLPAHFGMGRLKIFKNQILKHGGQVIEELNRKTTVTYIIVEETLTSDKVARLLDDKLLINPIVKCTWISACIKNNCCLDISEFTLTGAPFKQTTKLRDKSNSNSIYITNRKCVEDLTSIIKQPPDPLPVDDTEVETKTAGTLQSKFACAHSSSNPHHLSVNSHITVQLKKLLDVYKAQNDTWRVAGYQKAIAAIEAHPQEITSYEAARSIRGVGEKLAAKVFEIVTNGMLRKVEEVCGSEQTTTITRFLGVWGAGPATAHAWYTQGYRSLSDLREKAALTRHQKVGLEHYEDLNERIPRQEATEIHQYVVQCCGTVRPGLIAEVCGSYRRGRASCGDVDVLVTHPDGCSHEGVFKPLLALMRDKGFLTDDLVTQEDNGRQQKYLGVCRLPGAGRKHRRLDIIVVPYEEYAPAMLYFTGSAHFNRSMRLLATKLGMSLSEHGLRSNVVRQGGAKLTGGQLLDTPTEESVFERLGLAYRRPVDRDH